jgi:hypothetical protein
MGARSEGAIVSKWRMQGPIGWNMPEIQGQKRWHAVCKWLAPWDVDCDSTADPTHRTILSLMR